MRNPLPFCLITSAILTAACGPSARVDNNTADVAALQKTDEDWAAAAGRNDVDAAVGFYAGNAMLLSPNTAVASDQKSIRQAWTAILAPNVTLSWKASKVEVAKSGELGYIYATYHDSVQDPKGGPPVRDAGKIIEVWKKQSDGTWKCAVDIYNSDLPLPPAPEAHK